MIKKLIGSYKGVVVNKYLPTVFDGYQDLPEELIQIIGIDVKVNDKIIKLIKPRYSEYSNLFVADKVNINEYKLIGNYEEFLASLKEYINNYFSSKSKEYKDKIFNKYFITEEEYNKNPQALIDYEIM